MMRPAIVGNVQNIKQVLIEREAINGWFIEMGSGREGLGYMIMVAR